MFKRDVGELFLSRRRNGNKGKVESAVFGRFEQLPERLMCSATPAAAQFNAVDNFGVTQIIVDNKNLALVNGFHIIGSATGKDDANNVNSESPANQPGVMVSPNGKLPFSLTFRRDPVDASKLSFAVSVGPSKTTFNELNIPLECPIQLFTFYRSKVAPNVLSRYDQLPFAYANENGKYYAGHILGATWGEIIGPEYTMRVSVKSSRAMELQVVNAPGLAGGDRDIEFKFGKLAAGQTATATGTIQVFRTDASLLPVRTYQTEASSFHQTGRRDGNAWKATPQDQVRAFLNYGPYETVAAAGGAAVNSLPAGARAATFRLMVDNATRDNNRVVTIDVFDATTGTTLASLDVSRKMFGTASTYKDFTVKFTAVSGRRLEFRTFYWGSATVWQDLVAIR